MVNLSRKDFFILGVFMLLVGISIIAVSSLPNSSGIYLYKGDNNLSFNITGGFNVSTFIELNPGIEVISYKSGNQTVGYVNFMKGLGKDFEIESGINYEIYSSKNLTLIFP